MSVTVPRVSMEELVTTTRGTSSVTALQDTLDPSVKQVRLCHIEILYTVFDIIDDSTRDKLEISVIDTVHCIYVLCNLNESFLFNQYI